MDAAQPASPTWKRPLQPLHTPGHLHKPDRYGHALPSISYLDMEKIKRETSDYSRNKTSSAPTNIPAPLHINTSNMYSGPPPPYSYPSSTASSILGLTGYISPPESRRTSDDDKDPPSQPPSHPRSLPSIHEALGKDQQLFYAAGPPPPINPPTPNTSIPASLQTPPTPVPRTHPQAVLSGPPNPYASTQPLSYSHEPPDRRSQPTHRTSSLSEESAYPSAPRPPPHSSHPHSATSATAPSPNLSVRPSPQAIQPPKSSPMYSHSISATGSSMPSQPSYCSQPAYSYPPPPPSILSYQHQYVPPPAWRADGSDIDRAEETRKAALKSSPRIGQHYGESVKRHLDIFDLETSLNEIAEGSGRALDFSRLFGARAHANQRSGQLPGSLPTLAECDDMIRRQNRVMDSMARIREVIVTQQHALEEQRNREEANKESSDYGDDGNGYSEKGEGAGGFAGSDAKKRRGRHAPPGRCHSCNRAETPEWRRGPDGARTLCNACGLHYAKLTRKMGTKASLGGSNLRPKESGPMSPLNGPTQSDC
ncbi:hypothetical protein MMC19_006140 [Ptychographa xylographoides]|nr:hypothetical protein [Ptychographa xylographoides]